jgi:EAL domain-containing protein (putative c-di-GMP-specific phosphodiesterase class I)
VNEWQRWQGGGLDLVFQPIVSLSTYRVVGYEVLSRPYTASGQPLPVEAFFDSAALSGSAFMVDQTILQALTAFWQRYRLPVPIFWNVHPASVDAGILTVVRERFPASALIVEVTEKGDWGPATVPAIRDHQALGYRIALDDFGAGYSGLHRLIQVRPNIVKLDRDILQGVDQDTVKQQLIQAVTHLGRAFGFVVLAEGLETVSEILTCMRLDVDWGQGYYFAHPRDWSQGPEPDDKTLQSLVALRAQTILAEQAHTAYSPETRWARLLELMEALNHADSLADAICQGLRQAQSVSQAVWRVGLPSPQGWQWWSSDGLVADPVADIILQHWRVESPGRHSEWVNQDFYYGLPAAWEARAVAVWPMHGPLPGVLIGRYAVPNQWSRERQQWGRALCLVLGLALSAKASPAMRSGPVVERHSP